MSDSQSTSAQSPTIVEHNQGQSTDPSEVSFGMPSDDIPESAHISTFPAGDTEHDTPEVAAERLAARLQMRDGQSLKDIRSIPGCG